MELFIFIASFIGAWLLVAGSVYQAALELRDQDIERDRIKMAAAKVAPIPKVSGWWWFIPPVKFILERQRDDLYRKAYLDAMTTEDAEALVSFLNKSQAWAYVGFGGFLLALKETYELLHLNAINSIPLFILIVFLLSVVSVTNTVIRIRRSENMLTQKD